MRYYVKTGDLDCSIRANDHRNAALKAIHGTDKDLGVLVVVNEREIDDDDHEGNVYFHTQSIIDDCSMRVVR